jgi:hypothetical protein
MSYYGWVLANSTYVGIRNGVEFVRVNTSQFKLLQSIGMSYDFLVTFDPTIAPHGRRSHGRARARYVGPRFRCSAEDRLDPEGYRVRW